ncbi:MAG: aldose epimerase family protein [Pseudomonadota bacterium]
MGDNLTSTASISAQSFGNVAGTDVHLYTLTNVNELRARITTYGATLVGLEVPDRNGKLADVVLGFDDLDGYVAKSPYFGATAGRVANRIRDARFTLGEKTYAVAVNNPPHHLHGGLKGWDKVVWGAAPERSDDGPSLKLTYVSKDGDEGYPATVTATVVYTLTNKNELRVEMSATTDDTTIVNMAHHTYWNLGGAGSGRISNHLVKLHAARYTPGDPIVPIGTEVNVSGTPFDFTREKAIGRDLEAAGGQPIGFDHNFIVDGPPSGLRPVATLKDPRSGRVLTLEADQPGVQFYSGNYLDGTVVGKDGVAYAQYTGLCLETQKFPNAVNVPAWRGQVLLKPGQTYKHTMIHRFTAE